jgi:hypothetical protein
MTVHRHIVAVLPERDRQCLADATSRTGYQRDWLFRLGAASQGR